MGSVGSFVERLPGRTQARSVFWTKADAVTYFDDLSVTSLDAKG
jgi:hypothetical protein